MSIMRAMWTGVSGLNAEGQALGVIGDNVANSNTVGYKASRAVFEDVLGSAIGQNLGNGVRMMRPQQIFAQGRRYLSRMRNHDPQPMGCDASQPCGLAHARGTREG